MTLHPQPPGTVVLPAEHRIDIILEEYRALYALVTFRMATLDRRIPIAWAGVATLLLTLVQVGIDGQTVILWSVPLALQWFFNATVVHARSFEDVLRRIDEIERLVNHLAGDDLLVFQSQHPSQGRRVGGRTGSDTVVAVYLTALTMIGASCYLARATPALPASLRPLFLLYVAGILVLLTARLAAFTKYRYRRHGDSAGPTPIRLR